MTRYEYVNCVIVLNYFAVNHVCNLSYDFILYTVLKTKEGSSEVNIWLNPNIPYKVMFLLCISSFLDQW